MMVCLYMFDEMAEKSWRTMLIHLYLQANAENGRLNRLEDQWRLFRNKFPWAGEHLSKKSSVHVQIELVGGFNMFQQWRILSG